MNTSNQLLTTGRSVVKSEPGVFYAIKVRCQWPRTLCHICRQKMDHGDRAFAVFQGDTGILCRKCAEDYAPELARAVEQMYAPQHVSGMDLGGLPIDIVVRVETPLTEVAKKLRELADAIEDPSRCTSPGPVPA